MKRILLVGLLIMVGCKGPQGERGPTGPQGVSGQNGTNGTNGTANLTTFTGTIPANGIVTIGAIAADSIVSVYRAFISSPNVWTELGQPTGDNAVTLDAWSAVDAGLGSVYFYNCNATDKYKIVVVKKAPMPSSEGFGSRLLD